MSTRSVGGYPRSVAVLVSLLILIGSALVAPAVVFADDPPELEPIDPQIVTQAADQDWDDYHPIPTGPNYANPAILPTNTRWDVGLILADFPDTPFTVTQPEESNVFGNPGALGHDIPRANVPAFYVDWLNSASAANGYQTMNRYWMEDSFGRYGVNLVGYGPYQLFGDQNEYFIDDISGSNNLTCNVQTRSINSAQTNVSSIEVVSSASFSVGKVLTGTAPDGGGSGLGTARTVTGIPDATHLQTGPATTFANTSLAGASAFRVANTSGIAAGHSLNIGWDDRLEMRTVQAVGDGSGSQNLSAAAAAGATNIKIASVTGYTAGETILIEAGSASQEFATILTVGTAGAGGTGITLTAPLTSAHPSGVNVSGVWTSVTAPLTHGHASNTIVRDMNTTPLASVAANAYIHTCNRDFRTDANVAWNDHVPAAERSALDNFFLVSAGQDESGTWQEFGEMQFLQNGVPDEFGPPNPEITQNWAATRYIPWTSWRSAATVWPSASGNSSTEGEGSGMAVYAHELSHNLGLPDNYNNPYAAPFQRAATGYWSMMSRGSFGGPGGTHHRWHIPSTLGTALGSQHVLRDKLAFGFVNNSNFTDLNRSALGTSGLAVLDIQAREADPGASNQLGVRINMDGAGDQTVGCTVMASPRILQTAAAAGSNNIKVDSVANFTVNSDVIVGDRGNDELLRVQSVGTAGAGGSGVTFTTNLTKNHAAGEIVSNRLTCSGTAGFNNYLLEVNQQIGSDSFQAATGVLIEKNKTATGSSCGTFPCFAWVVDAHPTDINMADFTRPDDTIQWVTTGDPRQLTDATFHAGTNSGSLYEWEDTRNGLHFYILDRTEVDGVVHYTVAVQNVTNVSTTKGPHTRGVQVDDTAPMQFAENNGYCNFDLTNTGSFSSFTNTHPEGSVNGLVSNDVYRLSASATGAGWNAELPNALAYAGFGQTKSVPVYVTHEDGADAVATISLTATSVSDSAQTMTADCVIDNEAPTTTADLQPAAVNGFYHDPTVTLTADDGTGSGIASTEYDIDGSGWQAYSAPFQVTGDGPHTLLYRSTDAAGNVEDTNTLNFTIDTTGPVITIDAPVEAVTQAVGDPGNYPLGSEQTASYSCLDAISGHTSCEGPVESGELFDTSTVGFHTFTVMSDDLAGNSSESSVQYNVVYDGMTGFLPPIGSGLNSAQANSAVPIRFSLGGDYGLDVIASGYPISTPVDCTTLAPTGPALATQAAEPLVYEDGHYKYVWKTKKPWAGTCRELTLKLVDNTVYTAVFQFHN